MANELIRRSEEAPDNAQEAFIGQIIRDLMAPVLKSMSDLMRHNTEALERLAAQQKVQSDRMEALEKQIRLNTLVTPVQVRYLNERIRGRARSVLATSALEDDIKAVKSLTCAIRRSVLARYGVAALHDIPKHEYIVAMHLVELWDDSQIIIDIKKEARKRNEKDGHDLTGRVAHMDAQEALAGKNHQ